MRRTYRKTIELKEMPGWKAKCLGGKNGSFSERIAYEIISPKNYTIGLLSSEGKLFLQSERGVTVAPHKFIPSLKNVRQAMRYIFLKTQEPLKISDNAKKDVMKKYPKAKCVRDGAMFFVTIGKEDIGAGFSPEGAWYSAGVTISQAE